MEKKSPFFNKLAMTVWIVLASFLGIFLFPWKVINWGTVNFGNDRTVTVTGTSQKQVSNQIASFSVGVTSVQDKKEMAVAEVNKKMDVVVTSLQSVGASSADIRSAGRSLFQMEIPVPGGQKSKPGQWRASNNVSVALRDVSKASALADLLAKTGATNVFGPSFSTDNTTATETDLTASAMQNAREKATIIAKNSGASLGVVMSVVEGYSSGSVYPMMRAAGLGGGPSAVVEPGSSTVSRTLTVTFRLQ